MDTLEEVARRLRILLQAGGNLSDEEVAVLEQNIFALFHVSVQRPEDVARQAQDLYEEAERLRTLNIVLSKKIKRAADSLLALAHTGQPQEGRAAIIEECAKELDEWSDAVKAAGIHKEQIIAYRNGAAAIRALSAAPQAESAKRGVERRADHCPACGEYMPPHARHMCANWPPAAPPPPVAERE